VFGMLDNDGQDMIIFFVMLFSAPLDNIKINFCFVQGFSNGEIFVPIKKIRQACPMLYTRVNLKIKIIIILVLIPDLGVSSGLGLINQSRVMGWVDH